jgi:hypothetical protein
MIEMTPDVKSFIRYVFQHHIKVDKDNCTIDIINSKKIRKHHVDAFNVLQNWIANHGLEDY